MAQLDDSLSPHPEDRPSPDPVESPRKSGYLLTIGLIVGIVVVLAGLFLQGVCRVREAAARAQSQNNLKLMGTGVHNIASCYSGLEPPSVGAFPQDGPRLSLFFNLLPHMVSDHLYARYSNNPTGLTVQNGTIMFYCAPADPTNPGMGTLLTSYASNAAIFGLTDGGSVRFPDVFGNRGAANAILVIERYSVVGTDARQHTWHGMGAGDNYLYPPTVDPPGPPTAIKPPEYGIGPHQASDDAPHAFVRSAINVLLGDGSTRVVSCQGVRAQVGDEPKLTVWAWACCLDEPYGKFAVPPGW